jgi:hypothetical protein
MALRLLCVTLCASATHAFSLAALRPARLVPACAAVSSGQPARMAPSIGVVSSRTLATVLRAARPSMSTREQLWPWPLHYGGHNAMADDQAVELSEPPKELPDAAALLASSSLDILMTGEFDEFPQTLFVGGVTYMATAAVPPGFLRLIGRLTEEMFAPAAHVNRAMQLSVMRHNWARHVTCPVWVDSRPCPEKPEETRSGTPIVVCDHIGYTPGRSLEEVLEHVLHHVTDVGMAGAFPNEWGRKTGTLLHRAFVQACEQGVHIPCEAYRGNCLATELQEFAWWIILTWWDLGPRVRGAGGESFGLSAKFWSFGEEWSVASREQMRVQLPLAHELCMATVEPTLVAPSEEVLEALQSFSESAVGPVKVDFGQMILDAPSVPEALEWRVRNAEPISDHWNIGELEMYDEQGQKASNILNVICSYNWHDHDLSVVHNGEWFIAGGASPETWAGGTDPEEQAIGGSWLGFELAEPKAIKSFKMAQGIYEGHRVDHVWLEAKVNGSWMKVSTWGPAFKCPVPAGSIELRDGIYIDAEGHAQIPESLTSISAQTFKDCRFLISATLPDSITSIGREAFMDCSSMTSITLPDSLTSIGRSAFFKCRSVTTITVPDSVTSIGDYAFQYCDSLTSITLPDSVPSIGKKPYKFGHKSLVVQSVSGIIVFEAERGVE